MDHVKERLHSLWEDAFVELQILQGCDHPTFRQAATRLYHSIQWLKLAVAALACNEGGSDENN